MKCRTRPRYILSCQRYNDSPSSNVANTAVHLTIFPFTCLYNTTLDLFSRSLCSYSAVAENQACLWLLVLRAKISGSTEFSHLIICQISVVWRKSYF